jgi:Zn finger protein HypA/HybF involved in hydrogenase expression
VTILKGYFYTNLVETHIEAARAIFKCRRRAVELQPQSVADKPMRCPLCGKAGIRLVAFTDAAGALHSIGPGPMPCDSS